MTLEKPTLRLRTLLLENDSETLDFSLFYQFARPLGLEACEIRGVSLCCFYNSIAMAKRILPERFCLEPCPANRCQATPKVTRN